MIHVIDKQSDEIVGIIPNEEFWDDNYHRSLETTAETFEFMTFADRDYSEYLRGRNKVIIPDEDGDFRELTIWQAEKVHEHSKHMIVFAKASYNDLRKAQVIKPQTLKSQSASTAAAIALKGTEWSVGLVESRGTRSIEIEDYTNPYDLLKRIATEFDLELDFRIETRGNKIVGRYVDLVQQIGQWRGREIEFGKDLLSIRRIEDTDNIYTALIGLGPEKDGRRLEVLVEDYDALQRWGRRDPVTGELRHIIGTYEPQTEKEELSYDRLRTLTKNELEKRINEIVEYETEIADLEHVPGMENEKIRFGDTLKIKDTKFNPPLYVQARVFEVNGSIKERGKKSVKLGDYIEYTEDEVKEIWKSLQDEIKRSLARMLTVNIVSSAGDVFKNGEGNTELTAVVYAQGKETDQDGETYSYVWSKYDKLGNQDPDYRKEGKTITVQASEIDEKAIYACEVLFQDVAILGFTTLTNVYDGKEGEQGIPGPPGENGKTLYTWHKYADDDRGSGMSDNPQGKAYIGIAYNKESPIKSTNPNDYEWSKYIGDQGVPGPPGEDGQPNYTWVKYADDKDGNGMSDSPDDKRYLGLAYNKTSPNESSNPSDYSWSPLYDNVQVGGRNLLLNTTFENGNTHWSGIVEIVPNAHNGNAGAVNERSGYTGSARRFLVQETTARMVLIPSKTYTLSGWFYIDSRIPLDSDNNTFHIRKYQSMDRDRFKDFISVPIRLDYYDYDKWYYFEETASVPDGYVGHEEVTLALGKNGRIIFSELQLEDGNIATTYRPAPRDHAAYADRVSKEKAEEARKQAEAFSENASNIKKGVIDVGSVPIRTAANGARIQWDGTNGLVQYDSDGNPVSWLDLKGNSHFVNGYFSGEIHAQSGTFAGELKGASGTFGHVTVKNGDFVLANDETGAQYSATPRRNLIKDHSFELIPQDPSSANQDSIN
ncbi:phage tail spike protein, partial [Virgibacillus proomii]|uniref:phage tail spike protein n=1 Tax=Virgibacillus proomii TaxID=84407 RepID=UPI001C124F5D